MTAQMLQGGYLAVMQAQTRDEFRDVVLRFGQDLGFKYVAAMTVVDHSLTRSEFHSVDNTPLAYSPFSNDAGLARRDPVMQHCKHGSVPIIWNQETYVSSGHGDVWEEQAAFGYRTGIALALHMPEGRHFVLGVDRDRPLSKHPRTLTRIVAELQLFAVHAQDAAFRIFAPQPPAAPEGPSLSPRELEALRWTMDGKTAWEVGAIMNISERTAVLHLQNAMHKLACINKHQAVLKAIRLGLLS
jgi:DNA-binding CsgD family transcriptional regulator